MRNRTYYERLGVDEEASESEIETHYVALVKAAENTKEQLELARMFEILSDKKKRKQYDANFPKIASQKIKRRLEADLAELREQIERIKELRVEEEKALKKIQFVNDLESLYQEAEDAIQADIQQLPHHRYYFSQPDDYAAKCQSIRKSVPAVLIREKVVPTLKQLKFTQASKEQDAAALKQLRIDALEKCNKNPAWSHFGKAILAMCASAISMIVSATIGCVFGNCEAPVLGSIALFPAGAVGAKTGFEAACDWLQIPKGAFKNFLLFRTPHHFAIKTAAESGLALAGLDREEKVICKPLR